MLKKPGLIIYRAKRYHAYPQICSKYRLVPDQLDYNSCNLKDRKNRRMEIPRYHHISKVSHSVDLSDIVSKEISQLSIPSCYLRRFHLQLSWSEDEEIFNPIPKRVLRRFISKAKRVSRIEVELDNEKGSKTSILKEFALLRSVKNMKLQFLSAQKLTLQALQGLLLSSKMKGKLPHFEHAYLQFELKPENFMDVEFMNNYLMSLSEALTQYKQSPRIDQTNFQIRIPFFVISTSMSVLRFIQSIMGFPQLAYIGFAVGANIPPAFTSIIVGVVENLKALDLYLIDAQTELLPQIIQKALGMKSLQTLVIWMERLRIEPVKIFFRELKGLQQISCLDFRSELSTEIDDEALKIFGESLGNLTNLKTLDINLNMIPIRVQSVTITAAGIEQVFQNIGKLSKLEELNLYFNHHETRFTPELNKTLFNSLKELKELKILTLSLEENRFEEEDLALFEKYLKGLPKLENLDLNFQFMSAIKNEAMNRFLITIGALKKLKTLNLKLRCFELNDDLVSTIYSTVYNLKNLDLFQLNLSSDLYQDIDVGSRAYHKLLELEDRISVVIE